MALWTAGDLLTSNKIRQHPFVGAGELDVTILCAHIEYNGAAWVINTADFSTGISAGNLSYTFGILTVTVAGFSRPPVAIFSRRLEFYGSTVQSNSATTVFLRWFTQGDPPVLIQTPDVNMNGFLLLIGN